MQLQMFWAGESARTDGNYNVGFFFSNIKRVSIKCWWFQANFPFKLCKKWEKICIAGGGVRTMLYRGHSPLTTRLKGVRDVSCPEVTWSLWGVRCEVRERILYYPQLSVRKDWQIWRRSALWGSWSSSYLNTLRQSDWETERMQIRVVWSDNPGVTVAGWRWRYMSNYDSVSA